MDRASQLEALAALGFPRGLAAQLASSASEQTFALIEKTRKVFKCHRSSLDFDFRFIRSGGVVS